MGIFGKLFDKKECSVCGGEIGLLGNRKLEDGNLCKECAKKLSPWFEERRHSTVEQIKQQLAYREENRQKVARFSTSRSVGESWRVLTDDTNRWMIVTDARSLSEANPDVVDYSSVIGCRMDIEENRDEILRDGPNDTRVSYNPPRYNYHYNFYIIITVNTPYFDEMKFRVNPSLVRVEYGSYGTMNSGFGGKSSLDRILGSLTNNGFDPMCAPEYRQYYEMTQQICEEVRRIQNVAAGAAAGGAAAYAAPAQPQYEQPQAPAQGPWVCPACGGENNSKFCAYCGSPRP